MHKLVMNSNSFAARQRVFFRSPILLAAMAVVCTGVSLAMFYETLMRQNEVYLANEVVEQLNWLETIGRLNDWDPQETLKQYAEFSATNTVLGKTGECVLAVQEGNDIRFLLQGNSLAPKTRVTAIGDDLAEPMQQAVAGNVGVMIGIDYRGHQVLAAFAPVPNLKWGLVAKADLSEILAPFLKSALIIAVTVLVLIGGGIILVVFLGKPLIQGLEESRERLSFVIQGTRNGVWDWSNTNSDMLWWSGRCDELLGYGTGELTSSLSQFKSLLHPEDAGRTFAAIRAHLHDRIPFDVEYRLRTKSGEYRWYRSHGQALWNTEGIPIRMSGSFEDIHSRKQTEAIRLRSVHRLEAISRLHQALLLPEPLEQKFKRITKLAVEALNLDFCCIWTVKKGDLCEEGCLHAPANEGPRKCARSGRCLHLVSSSGRYTNINGDHRRIPLGCYQIGLIASGVENRFLIHHKTDAPTHGCPEWAESLGLESSAGYKVRNADDETIGVLGGFSKHVLDGEDDAFLLNLAETASMVILGSEASEILRQAMNTAKAAERAKGEFLANMSHEIRTPMTAILGFTEVLLCNPSQEEAAESARIIKRNGDHLLDIINDILDLSKIESGVCQIEPVACSPRQIVADVMSTMKVRADAKGLSVSSETLGDIPNCIFSDPLRLRQILVNLVGNAVKFTEVGGVKIVMQLESQTTRGPELRIDVVDTGIGLTSEQMKVLFRPFCQADGSVSRRFGGTGLGLAISQRLAKLLGGDIVVGSVFGKGSTFTLTIAAGPPNGEELQKQPAETSRVSSTVACDIRLNGRILLAEDGPDNQRLIGHILRKAGAEVILAENGLVAIDLALAAQLSGSAFAVILMDMQMPVMDGYEATRRLRVAGYTGSIVALTAHAMAEDRQKCLDAGCNDYTTKPIDRADLLGIMKKHADGQADLSSLAKNASLQR